MKRSLLAVALAVLSAVAVAEPTLDVSDNGFRAMRETTSYPGVGDDRPGRRVQLEPVSPA